MHIQNIDSSASVINIEGKEFKGKDGVFDLPDELAAPLVKFPHWREYDGNPWPHPKTEEEIEGERIAAVAEEVVTRMSKPAPKRRK